MSDRLFDENRTRDDEAEERETIKKIRLGELIFTIAAFSIGIGVILFWSMYWGCGVISVVLGIVTSLHLHFTEDKNKEKEKAIHNKFKMIVLSITNTCIYYIRS